MSQSYKKIEIIIIYDDTDLQELTFLKKITKKSKRISIIVNKKNLGAGLSRNIGINASKGEFIAFIDADDIWRKDKIYQQIKSMKKVAVFRVLNTHLYHNLILKQLDYYYWKYSPTIFL